MANEQSTIAILAKRSFIFRKEDGAGTSSETAIVAAGNDIVSVPAWVADTKHFELAEKDGGLIVVGDRPKSSASKASAKSDDPESDSKSKKNS